MADEINMATSEILAPPVTTKDISKAYILEEDGHGHLTTSEGPNFAFAEFGRDQIIAAEDLLEIRPRIVRDVILEIASLQGVESKESGNPIVDKITQKSYLDREEEGGKVHHEHRKLYVNGQRIPPDSEKILREQINNLGGTENKVIYYGSIDATPLYVRLVANYCKKYGNEILDETYTRKDGENATIKESLLNAISWIEGRINNSDIKLLEFQRTNSKGIENQVLTDSSTAYVHTNSRLANHDAPIAPIEVQGYTYDALIKSARLFSEERPEDAKRWQELANNLQRTTPEHFWMSDKQYFASALDRGEDGKPRQLQTPSIHPALLLDSTIFDNLPLEEKQKYISGIVKTILSPDFLTDAGIRCRSLKYKDLVTLPGSKERLADYHGANVVWPRFTYDVAKGFEKQGFHRLVEQLYIRIINSANIAGNEYEFFYVDDEGRVNYHPTANLGSKIGRLTLFGTNIPEPKQTWSETAVNGSKHRLAEMRLHPLGSGFWQSEVEDQILSRIPHLKILRTKQAISQASAEENPFTVETSWYQK